MSYLPPKPPLPSTALTEPIHKPWLSRSQHASYFSTLFFLSLGFLAAAFIAFFGYSSVPLLDPTHLCQILDEQFSSSSLDNNTWNYDIQLGSYGFGPNDLSLPGDSGFQLSTQSSSNIYISNNILSISPTLSSSSSINNFSLPDCTVSDPSLCSSSQDLLPPITSARIHTKSKKSIQFGRILIRAKLPIGDWLHPRIYLLPEQDTYGPFPTSGQIDIINARGNGLDYPAQGANYVTSALTYGPLQSVTHQIYGWLSRKRGGPWGNQFHDFVFEWDPTFIRAYIDKRTQPILESPIGPLSSNPFHISSSSPSSFYFPNSKKNKSPSFWSKASFPQSVLNDSSPTNQPILLINPYANASNAAPFDQPFYLVLELAVGGVQGWFPDGVGGKPWLDADGGQLAMRDFQSAQSLWFPTWTHASTFQMCV